MTQALTVQQPQTIEAKDMVEFTPFGSEDKIRLTLKIVRETIAAPAYDRDTKAELLPDNREALKFMMLCRSRRLNPFEGDAFMVPFWDGKSNRYAWSLITAHNAYLKRAETHPEFDGFESGVILLLKSGKYVEIQGDFVPKHFENEGGEQEEAQLVGGWARVHFKNRKIPCYRRSALSTFAQTFGQWIKNPSGMIVKVAEADALRSAFPTLLGGLYLKEEMAIEAEVVSSVITEERRPTFARGLPAPNLASEVNRGTQPAQANDKAKAPAASVANPKTAPATQTPSKGQTPAPAPAAAQPAPKSEPVAPKQGRVITPAPAPKPEPEPEGGFDAATQPAAEAAPAPETQETNVPHETEGEPAHETPAPEQQQEAAAPEAPERAPADLLPAIVPAEGEKVGAVKGLCVQSGVTESQVLKVLYRKNIARTPQKLRDLATLKLEAIVRNWNTLLPEFQRESWE